MWCQLGYDPSQNLIRTCQAVVICKILQAETTLGMTLERRKLNISRYISKWKFNTSKFLVKSIMTAQKRKKNLTKIFGVSARQLTYNLTQLKMLYYLDFSRTYRRLLKNPKIWNSRELCLPETDFKTYSMGNSAKWLKN